MKKILILIVFALPFVVKSQNLIAMRDSVENGYRFWLYEPKADSIKTAKPLIIFLHGKSLCGNNLYTVKRYGTIDAIERGRKIDAYVIAPQNPGGAWNPEKILNVLNWTTKHYNIDTTRVYVVGMSLGGSGTINFVGTYPEKIAAAMALCGGTGSLRSYCGLNKVPLWIIHGTADRRAPVAQSQKVVDNMKRCGETSLLIFDKWQGVNHEILARLFYLKETYQWLLSHSLTDSVRFVNREIDINKECLNTAYKNFDNDSTKFTLIDNSKNLDNATDAVLRPAVHTVKQGDTLSAIARKYGTSVSALCKLNKLTQTSILRIGQKIRVK
jgi:predicted peptidase